MCLNLTQKTIHLKIPHKNLNNKAQGWFDLKASLTFFFKLDAARK